MCEAEKSGEIIECSMMCIVGEIFGLNKILNTNIHDAFLSSTKPANILYGKYKEWEFVI